MTKTYNPAAALAPFPGFFNFCYEEFLLSFIFFFLKKKKPTAAAAAAVGAATETAIWQSMYQTQRGAASVRAGGFKVGRKRRERDLAQQHELIQRLVEAGGGLVDCGNYSAPARSQLPQYVQHVHGRCAVQPAGWLICPSPILLLSKKVRGRQASIRGVYAVNLWGVVKQRGFTSPIYDEVYDE